LIGALDIEKERILTELPFAFRVPWAELIVWINATSFELHSPRLAIYDAYTRLSPQEVAHKRSLMQKHRADVVWSKHPGKQGLAKVSSSSLPSRVHLNILEAIARHQTQLGCSFSSSFSSTSTSRTGTGSASSSSSSSSITGNTD